AFELHEAWREFEAIHSELLRRGDLEPFAHRLRHGPPLGAMAVEQRSCEATHFAEPTATLHNTQTKFGRSGCLDSIVACALGTLTSGAFGIHPSTFGRSLLDRDTKQHQRSQSA